MSEDLFKSIENTFRNSNNTDDLFDAFRQALESDIRDIEVYKILLGNPVLSKDEVIMFAEKLCKDFNDCSFDICMWTAGLLGNKFTDYDYIEISILYLMKAAECDPSSYEPYLRAINLFDVDLDIPSNQKIIKMVDEGLQAVLKKSKVYYSLAELYKKIGDKNLEKKYSVLAEKHALRGS